MDPGDCYIQQFQEPQFQISTEPFTPIKLRNIISSRLLRCEAAVTKTVEYRKKEDVGVVLLNPGENIKYM